MSKNRGDSVEYIEAKTILSKMKYGQYWFGNDYTMNLYKGCSHGCIYCDSRSDCYQIDHFDTVRIKKDALTILRKELSSKRYKGVVGIGAMSDTYNPFEKKYEITRSALLLLQEYQFGVSIDTKSSLITRDIDILKDIQKKNDVIVKITIITAEDTMSKKIEPHVCVSSERFKAVKELSDAGIFVGILMNPVLPFLTDTEENIKEMVRLAYESGAKFIHTFMGVTLRNNQRDYYYEKVDALFPGITASYKKTYGLQYDCKVLGRKKLSSIFIKECKKYGILYKMSDIIKAYKQDKEEKTQLSLFT